MSIEHSYNVSVAWKQGRMGQMATPDANDAIGVATPPQFPGGMEGIWSPEHLFTAAVNSCLMTTFLSIAENSKLQFSDFTSDAAGKLEMVDGKYVMSEVTLRPIVTIGSEDDRAKADKVLLKSEQNCLISNSVKSRIIFEPTVKVLQPILA
jgi:peroxiredoxin-like protein